MSGQVLMAAVCCRFGHPPRKAACWQGIPAARCLDAGSCCGTIRDAVQVVPVAASQVMLKVVRAAPGGDFSQGSVLVPGAAASQAVARCRDVLEVLPAAQAASGVWCKAEVAERPPEIMFP